MTESQPVGDDRSDRLNVLMLALRGHEFRAEITDDVLRLASPDRPAHEVEVRCSPRASDGGRLWYVGPGGKPLAEADNNIALALTAIKELTAVRM
jgi:hypothetical protein